MGAAAAFIAPPMPSFVMSAPPPPPAPPGFVAPAPRVVPVSSWDVLQTPPAPPAQPSDAEPPPLEPLTFKDPAPPRRENRPAIKQGPPRPPDVDDPFRRAAETLERLRRERRK